MSETKQLEAGEELDKLVAKKMGYPVTLGDDGRTPGIYVVYDDSKPYFLAIPGFSTEIDAAWRVIDFLKESGFKTEIGIEPHGCYAELSSKGTGLLGTHHAATVPHAVCLAFLALELE